MLNCNSSSFDSDRRIQAPSSSKPQQAVKIHKLKISNENIKEYLCFASIFFLLTRDWNSQIQMNYGTKVPVAKLQNEHIMEKFIDI